MAGGQEWMGVWTRPVKRLMLPKQPGPERSPAEGQEAHDRCRSEAEAAAMPT